MTLKSLDDALHTLTGRSFSFYTDIFSKAIWGDMGEDCASVTIHIRKSFWHIHFIRTQCGEPLPLSETLCNVIDEYEKDVTSQELFEFLAHHAITKDFEDAINTQNSNNVLFCNPTGSNTQS